MGEDSRNTRKLSVLWLRRTSQLLFLSIFLLLFLRTDYSGSDTITGAVNIFFRLDPFLALGVHLAVKTFVSLFAPAMLVILVSLLIGRVFCGWFCPMGTLLDLMHRLLPKKKDGGGTLFPRLSRLLLLIFLISSFLGFSAAGYLDPFALLVRGLALALYPAANVFSEALFTWTYQELPQTINLVTEPFYSLLKFAVLPSAQKHFQLAWLSLFLLAVIWLLELVHRRFFCRNLCPLGALLGLFAARPLARLYGGDSNCGLCRVCQGICPMGAVAPDRTIDTACCSVCFACVSACPRQIIGYGRRGQAGEGFRLSRRQFLGSTVAGFLLPAVKGVELVQAHPDPFCIRPPGALIERHFLARCVRCGECLQVCIGNALQPAFLQAGLDGVFSPVLAARTGYCEFNCTLCGQVCPSGAITRLNLTEKHTFKIGHAWFDKNLCLPYAKATPCMVCEEHCPTPEKAIKFRQVVVESPAGEEIVVDQPYVVDELCIGCGICEYKCPLPGKPAIFITRDGEQRNPDAMLPGKFGY